MKRANLDSVKKMAEKSSKKKEIKKKMKIKNIYVVTTAEISQCREVEKGSFGQTTYKQLGHKYLATKKLIKDGTPNPYNEFKLLFSKTVLSERFNNKNQENIAVVKYEPLGLYVLEKTLMKKSLYDVEERINRDCEFAKSSIGIIDCQKSEREGV